MIAGSFRVYIIRCDYEMYVANTFHTGRNVFGTKAWYMFDKLIKKL